MDTTQSNSHTNHKPARCRTQQTPAKVPDFLKPQTCFSETEHGLPIDGTPVPLPCPWCGDNTKVSITISADEHGTRVTPECQGCGLELSGAMRDPDRGIVTKLDVIFEAARIWNRQRGAPASGGSDASAPNETDTADQQRADDIRAFLASVKILEGCDLDNCFAIRGYCEEMALAYEDKERQFPTGEECLDILTLLTYIEPHDPEHCYGHSGDVEQCGLNALLDGISVVFGSLLLLNADIRSRRPSTSSLADRLELRREVIATIRRVEAMKATAEAEESEEAESAAAGLSEVVDHLKQAADYCTTLEEDGHPGGTVVRRLKANRRPQAQPTRAHRPWPIRDRRETARRASSSLRVWIASLGNTSRRCSIKHWPSRSA